MEGEDGPLSEEQRRLARAMAGYGAPRAAIALCLRREVSTIERLLGPELDQAEAEANTKVAQSLFRMATQKNNVAAAIFWMKARGGWREKQDVRPMVESDLSYLTDAELAAEIARLERELRGGGIVVEGTARLIGDDDGAAATRVPRGG